MNRRELGLTLVLLERMRTQRLPRLLRLRARVRRGARFDRIDIQFLREALGDTQRLQTQWSRWPEYGPIFSALASIYHEITRHALHNEQARMHHADH